MLYQNRLLHQLFLNQLLLQQLLLQLLDTGQYGRRSKYKIRERKLNRSTRTSLNNQQSFSGLPISLERILVNVILEKSLITDALNYIASRVCRQPGCLTTHQVLSYPKASIISSTASLVKLSPRVAPLGHFSENL